MAETTGASAWFEDMFTSPVMAILRGAGAERSLELARTAWDLGIDAVEVTVQSPEDLDALSAVVAEGAARGKQVGAGTILDVAGVRDARAAGAVFTVSPGLDADVVRASVDAGLPTLPGVATPSEVHRAVQLGLTWVKAFPAVALGPSWFTTLRGPFPSVRFVATGGMNAANAATFLGAGARVVAVGSALSNPDELAQLSEVMGR